MATLNNIADQIADAKGKSTDFPFKQRIKDIFVQQAATYIKQQVDKARSTTLFVHYYMAELVKVDKVDACDIVSGCTVLRSKNKIHRPIRHNGANPFEYIGTATGEPFTMVALGLVSKVSKLPFMGEVIAYEYRNGYIYVWLSNKLKYMKIGMIPEDFRTMSNDCASGNCWDDDAEFPIPMDMIQQIKEQILQAELSIDVSNTDEVNVELNKEK